jgi:hypothetical protein
MTGAGPRLGRRVALLAGCLSLACACASGQSDRPADVARSGADGVVGEAKATIAAVAAVAPPAKRALERIFGMALSQQGDTAAFTTFVAEPTGGPFGRVELRQDKGGPGHSIILEVREGATLVYGDFRGDGIPAALGPTFDPAVGPAGSMTFVVTTEKYQVSYSFEAGSERLLAVGFHSR